MAPAVRLISAMTGLVLLTAAALLSLSYRGAGAPVLWAELAVVASILVLAVALALTVAPYSGAGASAARPGRVNVTDASAHTLEEYARRDRMFSALVGAARHPIITLALDGTITSWNPVAERLYEFTAAEALGANIDIIVPADLRAEHTATVARALGEGPVENFETARISKSGRRIDVSLSLRPIMSADGSAVELAKITRDITAQRFAEEKFRLALESFPSSVVVVDHHGKIVMVNNEVGRLFGYQRDELIGATVDILVPARMRGHHLRHREGFAHHPEGRRMGAGRDLFGLRKDGTEFPIEVGLNPIRTSEGLLVLSAIVDITERKRLDRLKDEFVSTVSHELRTPLTSISGSLGLLIGGAAGALPESAARLLAIAQSNSQRLVRLVNDILDIEKMESGQLTFCFRRVDARALAEQVIEANRGFADGYGIGLRLDPAAVAADVHVDPDRLAQVMTNLLSNAIKFSPPNGEVTVSIANSGGAVRLSVRDHGPGVPADFRPHMFEKFAQADASNARRKSGTGLGLSIAKQIVTRLGGTVSFADAAGGGTVFHVELASLNRVTEREIDPGRSGAARILLCVDDPGAAIAVREGLEPFGFATDFAHVRADALERAAATPYRAVIVDLELPDSDNIALIHDLRAQNGATPVIAVSADPDRQHGALAAIDASGIECLHKPVDTDRLAQILDQAMQTAPRRPPQVLHVDDDHGILDVVARALGHSAKVISVDSIEEARRALNANHFDLAVLDIALGPTSGLDLLPDLRTRAGRSIPVIIFSAQGPNPAPDLRVDASVDKSQAALDSLIATVHDRLAPRPTRAAKEVP
jgi:PAS domain S-box-containing protein